MSEKEIPAELFDAIIDFSHADPSTLKQCSLVSKAWLPASRLHLFQHGNINRNNFTLFLSLLDSEHCSILPYVQAVTITGPNWKSLPEVVESLGIFSELRTLRFKNVYFEDPPKPRCLQKVQSLFVLTSSFRMFTHLTELVASFPSLKYLGMDCSMDFCAWLTAHSEEHISDVPPTLHTIQVIGWSRVPIFGWLTQSACNLKTIGLGISNVTDVFATMQYLSTVGPSVEHLDLADFLGPLSSETPILQMDFTHNTNLKYLHFHLDNREFHKEQAIACTTSLLSHIRSASFTDLAFTVYGGDDGPLHPSSARYRYECVIKHLQLVSLERVELPRNAMRTVRQEPDMVGLLSPADPTEEL